MVGVVTSYRLTAEDEEVGPLTGGTRVTSVTIPDRPVTEGGRTWGGPLTELMADMEGTMEDMIPLQLELPEGEMM